MKNICIITFHCAHNYGAVLQAYALKKYLERIGNNVYFYDYRPKYLINKYKIFNLRRFISFNISKCINKTITELAIINTRYKKYHLFEKFINSFLLNNKNNAISPGTLATYGIDYIILGSDQIWNTNITKGIDKIYWGDLDIKIPCISYAASMECKVEPENEEYIKNSLTKFKAISVRENNLHDFLLDNLNIKSQIVTDPTFLLSEQDWLEISSPIIDTSKFILLYYFGYNKKLFDKIENYATKIDCKLIIITVGVNSDKRCLNTISPENFIWLIKNAQLVITNSFHGTAFSIIFKTPFYTLKKEGSNSRIESLCKLTNLEDRILDKFSEEVITLQKFKVDFNLENRINTSKEYLKTSIE